MPGFRLRWPQSKAEKKEETERLLRANDPAYNGAFNYHGNTICTAKYSVLTFLPLNLFEQFQRLANAYFFVLLVLQLIPWISSLTWVTTIVPLIGVLTVTAIKDAYDDIQRHKSDKTVNNRISQVLRDGDVIEEEWHNVVVGDIVKMEKDQFVAADLLLLATSEPNGLCYVETAELDGETNLKVRQALAVTELLGSDVAKWYEFKADVACEPPNNNLMRFDGCLTYNGSKYSISNDQILLRGCVLRNTEWCFGLVIFAGPDTKLMKNSGKVQFKRTHTDRLLNTLILGIFAFLVSICFLCVICSGIWETTLGNQFQVFLPWPSFIPGTWLAPGSGTVAGGATALCLLVFFSYLIVLNTVVPISLYVSVEILRLHHSLWINYDKSMYYEPKDTPAKAHTTTLNEELGQIEYIFTDKTGTLTQNVMTFNKCSINGCCYGGVPDSNEAKESMQVDFTWNPYGDTNFEWYDDCLVTAARNRDPAVEEFFRVLAICHTVMPDIKDGILTYQAQSPDEHALVTAAKNMGFVFKARTPTTITLEVHGTQEVYELLSILDFNNDRKRMSVIVRKNGEITLMCKGADTMIYQRLSPDCAELKDVNMSHLNDFANIGLRTLCLATRKLNSEFYASWKEKHHAASILLRDREAALQNIYELVETDLQLVGSTAIEDKLQDGVPQAIANLALAGIKIWVLTGDKQETAINIGYACKLLTETMQDVFVVDGEDAVNVQKQLQEAKEQLMQNSAQQLQQDVVIVVTPDAAEYRPLAKKEPLQQQLNVNGSECSDPSGYALVINGLSLVHALADELSAMFLEVGCLCRAVICCRVTPLQKAQVVELVKKHKKSITLAIGDGANDVSMIKTAHIGVGISGQEGMQAVLASDYSFAQFRFLERLLLVHGRWSYLRMSKFLQYFFYKNFAFTLGRFWYAFFNGFSADPFYDPWFIAFYNVVYTSLPVLALGFFDQDVGDSTSLAYPKLYTPGLKDMLFNKKVFYISLAEGILTSAAVFFLTMGALNNGMTSTGLSISTTTTAGVVVAATVILTVTLRCALDTQYWTGFNHVVLWGSIVSWFVITLIMYTNVFRYSYVGSATLLMSTAQFWLVVVLVAVVCLVPRLCYKLYCIDTCPTLSDRLRLRASIKRSKSRPRRLGLQSQTSIRREQRGPSLRSGYAFAHEEGMGRIITQGLAFRRHTT